MEWEAQTGVPNGWHPASKTPVVALPWTCWTEDSVNDRANRLAGKATLRNGLLLGRSEVLRSLRHYLRAQSQGHHTIDRVEERGVERVFLEKMRERNCHSDEHWNRSEGNIGENSEKRKGAYMDFTARIYIYIYILLRNP